ncbi:energy-coupling factor ABC transporter ATP-binding protein [Peribacillus kribbensis]|uniref:energy-coupling factor ABC transporter ATP-binding protein n=1 Tax=Peribacillus kribbensis TaxID=356658 RepID=UPI000419714C|nr:energy-coupling factor ABC transporter ATP-binding protein [Peribacillus kribbensis]
MRINLQNVEHKYQVNTPFERAALTDVTIDIPSGTYLAVIGHTGSGKSTLLQHLNGLLQPTKGYIQVGEQRITAGKKEKNLKAIRKRVGIVFQFPEHQLFEETVLKDICFGPMNFGVSEEEAIRLAKESITKVGLGEEILEKSPFDLSGGQMRRVAIAGVLAMQPEVLVLDEPTAGLDPRGRKEIMDLFYSIHKDSGISTILVTHSMEDAARYADEIVVMHKGSVFERGKPRDIFSRSAELAELGLDVPNTVKVQLMLERSTGLKFGRICLSLDELTSEIAASMKRGDLS